MGTYTYTFRRSHEVGHQSTSSECTLDLLTPKGLRGGRKPKPEEKNEGLREYRIEYREVSIGVATKVGRNLSG